MQQNILDHRRQTWNGSRARFICGSKDTISYHVLIISSFRALTYLAYFKTNSQHVAARHRCFSDVTNPSKTTDIVRSSRSSLLPAQSFLRRSGFYVWLINEQRQMANESRVTLYVGLCLFFWSILCSISLEVSIGNALHQDGWTLQWNLRVQNRVQMNSPLMEACQQGDVLLIRQILEQKRGSLNDQVVCSGKTALLVS